MLSSPKMGLSPAIGEYKKGAESAMANITNKSAAMTPAIIADFFRCFFRKSAVPKAPSMVRVNKVLKIATSISTCPKLGKFSTQSLNWLIQR